MLYQLLDCTVTFGPETVLSHIRFEVKGSEKIALVGRNGAGKTTLLKVLAGEITPDRDDKRSGPAVSRSREFTSAMLSQTVSADADSEKSGGEQTRAGLLKLFSQQPDLLLLDEPTNHLDVETTEWLEKKLRKYPGAVVMVSHDRFFLDRTADIVYELSGGTLTRYPGNYTHYREEKERKQKRETGQYLRQQKEINRLHGLIERFKNKPAKAAMTRSKRKYLERMELIRKPPEEEAHIFEGRWKPEFAGPKKVWEAQRLKIGYEHVLYEISMKILRGQKIALIGRNGAGKTALLKTVSGMMPPCGERKDNSALSSPGRSILGNGVTIGYFDQHSAEIESDLTVAAHYHRLYPVLTEQEVRTELGRFLFGGREAQKKVSSLSGGEKARLVLAEILKAAPNFLLLDEPTNHMDIPAKETLESVFRAYTGTILFVSHDRYFISRVAQSVLTLENDGRVMYYPFGYEHYLEHRNRSAGSEEISAEISAEEEALIAGIRAVPEAERHRIREMPAAAVYEDWQKRLAGEKCERALSAYENAGNALLSASACPVPSYEEAEKKLEEAHRELTEALIEYDEKCSQREV